MIVGGYTLHLYCDFHEGDEWDKAHGYPETPADFAGRNEAICFTAARAAGWKVYRLQYKAKCPICVKEKK